MRVQVHDYQNKAALLRKALTSAGHEIVSRNPDALLIDFDGPVAHYPKIIEQAYSEGAAVFVYSHGAMPIHGYDGIWEPSDKTSAYLAMTPGQAEVMRRYGYPLPVHVIGWHYCEQRKFKPAKHIKRVLFAPWHPHGNGWMLPAAKALNQHVYRHLLSIPGIDLTVRHARTLYQNGIDQVDGVNYIPSDMTIEGALRSIDNADLVVSHGTLAYLSVARGKPTVFYGQDIRLHDGYSETMLRYVKHWDEYRDYMRYPYDVSASRQKATWNVMQAAAQNEAAEWRSKFIGKQFDGKQFAALLGKLVQEAQDA